MTEAEKTTSEDFNLCDHFLIAMPNMLDPGFAGTVVYLCEHSPKGAMGLIVNRPTDISIHSLLEKVDLEVRYPLPSHLPVMQGGPVASERGFVLHTGHRRWNSSLAVSEEITLTTSKDILEAVAEGNAPEDWLITLGYAGWSEGQLEEELSMNAWLTVKADKEILFRTPLENRFSDAFGLLGIDPLMISSSAGHA